MVPEDGRRLYCCGFLFEEGRRVLLVEKRRPAWQAGLLNGVGGKVEGGETPLDAMVREFREEAGLHVPAEAWRHFATLAGDNRGFLYRVDFFVAHGRHDGFAPGTDEPVSAFDAAALPPNTVWNVRWLIPLALDAGVVVPVTIIDNGDGG
jgi:8-oxo-dGTP diphosphatase